MPAAALLAQSPAEAGYSVLARGPMEKLWAKLSWQTNKDGSVTTLTNSSFTEMADGLEYWDDQANAWKDSQDLIEIQPAGGAAALHGRVKAYFKPNLNAPGAITLVDSNRVFRCEPISLFYYDEAQDKTVPLAGLKDCSAELLPPNQIVYKSVLDKISADYVVTYTKGAIEAELVLRQRPKPPEYYGLNSNTTTLEWWTQWQSPQPSQTPVPIVPELGFDDSLLDFGGGLIFPRGRAFATGNEPPRSPATPATISMPNPNQPGFIPVAKHWNDLTNASVMVEAVLWTNIAPTLSSLPEVAQAGRPAAQDRLLCMRDAVNRPGRTEPGKRTKPILLASATDYRPKGAVLDWEQIYGGTDYTFGYPGAAYTYSITNNVTFTGTVTLWDGATLKFSPWMELVVSGSLTCNGSSFSPTILTSQDDDLYGQTLPWSTHLPSKAAGVALYLSYLSAPSTTVKGLLVRWAHCGIQIDDYTHSYTVELSSLQFSDTGIRVQYTGPTLTLLSTTYCNVPEPLDMSGQPNGSPTDICTGDANSDGVPDYWEYQWFGTTSVDLNADSDGDGTNNLQEYISGSNPADYLYLTSCYPVHDYVLQQGTNISFQVTPNLSSPQYQWYAGSTPLGGATTSALTLANIGLGLDLKTIHATVSSDFYSITTTNVELYVLDALRWAMWTNFIRQTSTISGISNIYEAEHTHRTGWPNTAGPIVAFYTNSFLCQYRGFTGISLCNARELSVYQGRYQTNINVPPITALTDRIGYLRGHGVAGPRGLHVPSQGYTNDWNGTNIWFCDTNNNVVQDVIAGAYVGDPNGDQNWDFTLVFFKTNLSDLGIAPVPYVMAPPSNWNADYHICFKKTQNNDFDTGLPQFADVYWGTENGNSGGPLLLPLPSGDLVFMGGITTAYMTGQAVTNMQTALTNLFDYFSANATLYQGSLDWQRDFQFSWYTQ